ncbi:hypothetical protein AQUCO_04900182v1 [Aquilegia coerulea]|uniref:Knottin scorpion toxin-like domain-containing protein n=1 Tax=Aquilegia coerulea TaxID=218851 RepID=A0A2G5CKA1_AQUCA|nr:hypothetical protein AQUCO_04900182v1 [Aquilegia coerulea]
MVKFSSICFLVVLLVISTSVNVTVAKTCFLAWPCKSTCQQECQAKLGGFGRCDRTPYGSPSSCMCRFPC